MHLNLLESLKTLASPLHLLSLVLMYRKSELPSTPPENFELPFEGKLSQDNRLFWFLCGNEVYTDSLFNKIVLKVFPSKHFTIS